MGSSSKKKKDKQKDFKKTKLKVGKEKAKPTNYTDTSFVSKTISLPNQSLNRIYDIETDISKRLTLLKHHQSSTRKETLIYIEQHLPSTPSLYKQILTSAMPLIIDQSASVRSALVDLLVCCSSKQPNLMELHARSIILFIHSAMTHITPGIRNDSVKFLDVLIKYGPDSLMRSSWVKTLRSFFTLLHWTLNDSKQSVSLAITTSSVTNTPTKSKKVILESFHKFIQTGCYPSEDESNKLVVLTLHHLTNKYLMPVTPAPFAHLQLYAKEITQKTTEKTDLTSISCEDFETRRKVFLEHFSQQVLKNIATLVKEGGEVGKSAKAVQALVESLIKENDTKEE